MKTTRFSDLPSLKRLEYDIGTHIRCMKFVMGTEANLLNSEKAGGFSLDKNKAIDESVGKIEVQTLSNDGKIGRVAFYDREHKLMVEIKGSYGLNGDK